ncbi:MAG: hypothetical protein HC866_11260 [Leptolyngbyaceae cyanobacterium RU_5_1]|nr:hypothetical protein [Leptolyngbyaceae cyanobacterium RU_5_1]
MTVDWRSGMFWLGMGVAIATPLTATPGLSQMQALPPPPSVPDINTLPNLSVPALPDSQLPSTLPAATYPQESVYRAPIQAPASYPTAYQVVVNGDSPYLLQRIQQIDPSASIQDYQGRRMIQVGTFMSELDAQQRVAALAQLGIGAQAIAVSAGPVNNLGYAGQSTIGMATPTAIPNLANGPHFQVVVPTRPEEFGMITGKMMSMGVKPEAIKAKRAPLGPHLSVGPFAKEDEAESVSRYLRTGGMDARVYYAK